MYFNLYGWFYADLNVFTIADFHFPLVGPLWKHTGWQLRDKDHCAQQVQVGRVNSVPWPWEGASGEVWGFLPDSLHGDGEGHPWEAGLERSLDLSEKKVKACSFSISVRPVQVCGLLGTRQHNRKWVEEEQPKLHLYLQLLPIACITTSCQIKSSIRFS